MDTCTASVGEDGEVRPSFHQWVAGLSVVVHFLPFLVLMAFPFCSSIEQEMLDGFRPDFPSAPSLKNVLGW